MNEKLTEIKVAIAAFFTAVSAFLGWQGVLGVIWVAAMGVDYLSGTLAAKLAGEWKSGIARDGLMHKAGMFFAVIVAGIADIVLLIICDHLPLNFEWPVLLLPLVFAWYILTELGSILENAVKMGAPIPEWLTQILTVGLKVINAKGDEIQDDILDEVKSE